MEPLTRAVIAAGIYVRISKDRTGEALGVRRQRYECEELARRRGWPVAEIFEDNDISAFSGKLRPSYERMLEAVRRGSIDAIVTYNPDRLHRSPLELELFIDLVESRGVAVDTVGGGEWDLTTADSRAMARVVGVIARMSSEKQRERLRSKQAELARDGKLSGGGHRPFGYEKDRLTVREDEADVIRELAKRFLSGETFWSLTVDLQDRGITTSKGNAWRPSSLRSMLISARISGRREHKRKESGGFGEITGTAVWPAIISPEDSDRIRTLVANPSRRTTPGSRRSHLLSGFLRCGRCGCLLVSHTHQAADQKKSDLRRYGCYRNGNRGDSCGRLAIVAPELELEIVRQCLYALDSPALARTTAAGALKAASQNEADLLHAIQHGEQELEELAEAMGRGELEVKLYLVATKGIQARVAEAVRSLDELRGVSVGIGEWVGRGKQLGDQWDGWSLGKKRDLLGKMIDHVVIAPSRPGANRFDPGRLDVRWKS